MYGDPDQLDALAAQIRQRAQDVRDHMGTRMTQSDAATWHSVAADEWRKRVREETDRSVLAAGRLDDAAAALVAHAQECRETIARIAAIERQVRGWLSDQAQALRSRGEQVVSGAADLVTGVAAAARSSVGDVVTGAADAVEGLGRGFADGVGLPGSDGPVTPALPPSGDVGWLAVGRSMSGHGVP